MTRHALWPLLGGVLSLGLMGPARADNPKISLKLQDAPAGEVIRKLSEATGVPIELSAGHLANERLSFDWSTATLGRALRDLCARLNLQPNKKPGGGYMLYLTGAPAGPAKPVGLADKNGVKLSVRSVSVYDSRYINFAGPGTSFSNSNLNLQIGAELVDGDGETVAGIENVTGRDDQGNNLTSPNQGGAYYGGYSNQLPDEWLGSLTLGAPHAKARKIQWIEGDLMVYKAVKHHRAEIPLPITEKSVRREAGNILIVASRYQIIPKPEEEGDDADLPGPKGFNNNQDFGPSVRVRAYMPVGARFSSRVGGYGIPPMAVGESGKVYAGNQWRGGGSSSDGQWQVSDTTWIFPGMAEKPVKLVWDVVEKSDPVKLFSFRMSDIPLPDPAVPAPRPAVPARPGVIGNPAAPPEMPHPFYQKGGGALVGTVAIGPEGVREGSLEFGLAARTATGWGPVRWTDVVIGPDGAARLEEIKPGEYRVVRRFRGTAAPAGGSWTGAELRVKVLPGKSVALPVLRWSAASAPPPAPGKPTATPAPRK